MGTKREDVVEGLIRRADVFSVKVGEEGGRGVGKREGRRIV